MNYIRFHHIGLVILCGIFNSILLSCSKDDGPKLPGPATLQLPANLENCVGGNSLSSSKAEVTFSWSVAPNTDSYILNVSNLVTGEDSFKRNIVETTTTYSLAKGYPYKWFITSTSETLADVAFSPEFMFFLASDGDRNSPPFPAVATSPPPGSTIEIIDNSEVLLSWKGADPENDILNYDLYIDNVDGLQTPLPTDQQNLTESEFSLQLNANKVYFWSVLTTDSFGNTSKGQVYSFKTK